MNIHFNIDDDLGKELKKKAVDEGRSLSEILRSLVSDYLDKRKSEIKKDISVKTPRVKYAKEDYIVQDIDIRKSNYETSGYNEVEDKTRNKAMADFIKKSGARR